MSYETYVLIQELMNVYPKMSLSSLIITFPCFIPLRTFGRHFGGHLLLSHLLNLL